MSEATNRRIRLRKPPLGPAFIGFLGAIALPSILLSTTNVFFASPIVTVFVSLAAIWGSFLLGYLLYRGSKAFPASLYPTDKNSWRHLVIGIFGGLILQIALVLLGLLIILSFGFDPNEVSNVNSLPLDDSIAESGGFLFTVFLLLAVSVGAPLFEELFFRGVVLPTVATRLGPIMGVMISAIMFGSLHLQASVAASIYTVTLTTLAGVILGITRIKSRSLSMPIFVHMGFNSWAMIIFLLATG